MSWQFTVGLRVKRKADRIVVDAEDALIAALKVKAERPEATILYVRRLNQRGRIHRDRAFCLRQGFDTGRDWKSDSLLDLPAEGTR